MLTTRGVRHYFETWHFETLALRRSLCCASALTGTVVLAAWLLGVVFSEPHHDPHATLASVSSPVDLSPYNLFLDSRFDVYFSRDTFSKTLAQPSDVQLASATLSLVSVSSAAALSPSDAATPAVDSSAAQPLYLTPRASRQPMPQALTAEASTADASQNPPSDNKNVVQRFLAKLLAKFSPSSVKLASAATDDSQLDSTGVISRYDPGTAVYDIASHTVYMPDGNKLEAHSGYGESLDDPAQVDGVNTGATPPNVYNLELRDRPFHGVRALRLIPVDDQKTFGRTGLLAHSFLLGPNGQSNGCVSFRDYDAFLHAYLNHQVKRLVVVARLD